MGITPSAMVEAANRQPLPFGLFSVLSFRPDTGHWQNGVFVDALTCEPAGLIGSASCTTTAGLPLVVPQDLAPLPEAESFSVYGHHACMPFSLNFDQMQDRAQEHLEAREEAAAELALWSGFTTPNLPAVDTVIKAGTLPPGVGLGLLEQFNAEQYGSLGVIHMSRYLATVLGGLGLLVPQAGVLRTKLNTPVVAGAGYPGGVSGGYPAATAYVTPALFGYRTEVFFPSTTPGDTFDRGTNMHTAVAERTYLIGWDGCGVGSVQIDPTATTVTP